MAWQMQIKAPSTNDKWVSIRPTGKDSVPYEYETKKEAEHMLNICYREVARGFFNDSYARVVEV